MLINMSDCIEEFDNLKNLLDLPRPIYYFREENVHFMLFNDIVSYH